MNKPGSWYELQIVRNDETSKGAVLFRSKRLGHETDQECDELTERYEAAVEALKGIGVPCSFRVAVYRDRRQHEAQ